MKALIPLLAALLLTSLPARTLASDPPLGRPPLPVDPTNPAGAAPTVIQPAPEMPAPGTAPGPIPKKPDPALDVLPVQPGQLSPEPTLTPEFPPASLNLPADSTGPKVKVNKTEAIEQDLALRIHYRQARTHALEDPAVQAEWHNQIVARTDLLRREALTRYYKLLFARMLKTDPSIQKLVAVQSDLAIRRVQQARVSPTEALDPEESSRRGVIAAPFTADGI